MSDNRRAPDIEQRLLDAHRAQQQHRQRHQAGAEQAGGSGHEDEAAQQPFLSASEERLSRLLGRLLTVTLSDQRTYCGRLYCIDRLSLLLSEAVQTVPRAAQHAAMDRSHAPPVDSLTGDERAALELRVGSVLIGFEHVRRVVLRAAPRLVLALQADDEQARQLITPLAANG